ncbi:MAG: MFS transporter [Aggregatilineales bacterium]
MTHISSEDSNASPIVPRRAEFWVLVATILPSSMGFISTSGLDAASPALQTDLGIISADLFWIINIYALFLSALILVGGSLGDHYGRKRVFMFGIGLFTVVSFACGLAPNSDVLIGLRALQGVGAALMIPGSLAILTVSFPPERRGQAIGTWSTFSAVTSVLGAPLGGWIAGQGESFWRAVFFINIPFGIVALLVLLWYVPESRDEEAPDKLDFAGTILATLGLGGLTYGFLQAPSYGFDDPRILFSLIGGLAACIAFVIVEARSDHPMMPLGLFKSTTFSGANLLTLFLYGALRIVPFFLILNLVQVQGYPQEIAGFTFLPFGIMLTLMGRWAGGLVDRIGSRIPLIIGPLITGAGFFLMSVPGLTNGVSDYWTTYFPGIMLTSIGMGILVAPLTTTVMSAAPSHSSGTASGINNAVSRTAGVLSIAIMGAVAILVFSNFLTARADDLRLSPDARAGLAREANNLGDAQTPLALVRDVLDGRTNPMQMILVQYQLQSSYIQTFRLVAIIGAVMAWVSALMAALLIKPHEIAGQSA